MKLKDLTHQLFELKLKKEMLLKHRINQPHIDKYESSAEFLERYKPWVKKEKGLLNEIEILENKDISCL